MTSLLIVSAAAAMAAAAALAGITDPVIVGAIDAQLTLQDTTTQTANANSAGIDLGAGYAPSPYGRRFTGVVNVTAADRSDGNETYAFKLQESDDNSTFSDASASVSVPVSGNSTTLGVLLVRGVVKKRFVRLSLVAAGTSPSVTYKAWLRPD